MGAGAIKSKIKPPFHPDCPYERCGCLTNRLNRLKPGCPRPDGAERMGEWGWYSPDDTSEELSVLRKVWPLRLSTTGPCGCCEPGQLTEECAEVHSSPFAYNWFRSFQPGLTVPECLRLACFLEQVPLDDLEWQTHAIRRGIQQVRRLAPEEAAAELALRALAE